MNKKTRIVKNLKNFIKLLNADTNDVILYLDTLIHLTEKQNYKLNDSI